MSQPTTSTDFDKYGTFKITSSTVKRSSNESHSHDDESKKLRLEKSGSSSSILTTSSVAAVQAGNNLIIASAGDTVTTKKLKTRKVISDGSTSQQYQLIIEDSAGAFSEESCGGGGIDTSTKAYSTTGGCEEMVLVRKQVSAKGVDNNDVGIEERVIPIEGDPGGTSGSAYLTTMSAKPTPKRLQIGMAEAKKSLGDSIDLKLITATGDNVSAGKFSVLSAGDKKSEHPQQILLAASSSAINTQNTFTYSRVCSVGNVTGSGDSVSLKSLQGTVKNQSLVVSSKKLIPEVTQTTAKVSIGNTTISVPLLKPLNSTQIIQPGGSATAQSGQTEGTKSVIHTIQTSTSQSPQTQLSKILNIKRGQKVTQPTFLSLSQLQIKPVSSQKIVQAKVLSKKLPLQIQAVATNKSTLLQQTSGLVTITSTKPELHGQQTQGTVQGHILPSPQKKQHISIMKDLPVGAVIKTTSRTNPDELASSSSQVPSSSSSSNSEQPKSVVPGLSVPNTDKSQMLKNAAASTAVSNEGSSPSLIAKDFLPAGVKVVHTSSASHLNSASLRQSATTQMENMDQSQTHQTPQTQTQRINICPTISIVRQNSPQMVTTSTNISTVSISMADTVCGQQKLVLTKSQFANVSSANTSGANAVTTNFPRNISLMLAKNTAGQQVFTNAGSKATLCVTTSANAPVGKSHVAGRMNLSINPNILNATSNEQSSSGTVAATESDSGTSVAEGQSTTPDTSLQMQPSVQQTNIQSNIIHNRKIIQVLPGGLYSSSGGSFVQITKSKTDPDDDKKVVEVETTSAQHVQQQQQQQQQQQLQQQQQQQTQHQHIHLQIQQSQVSQHQAAQHQQQHQIHLQIQQQQQQQQHQQQQQQQQQSHQHIQIQQIQTQVPQQQLQRHQLLQQQRQHMIHKQHIQLQLQKQPQQQQQQQMLQQQQSSQPQDANTSTESNQCHPSFSTPPATGTAATDQQQHASASPLLPPPKTEESNNVLLKQLLQNSSCAPINNQSSSQSSRITSVSASTSTALPSRKVINVRAPSLGLVSSLEAQLARPVIPPVPASESTTQPTAASVPAHAQTQTSTQTSMGTSTTTSMSLKTTSQSLKVAIENAKVASTSHSVHTQAPTTPHSLATSVSTATSVSSASALIITTSKALSSVGVVDKPKFASSPLISKETSFVSKPTMPEHSEQNIELFSLQSSEGVTKTELQQQQQFEHLTTTTSGQQQMANPTFKAFTTSHATAGQSGPSTTTKVTKFVHDAKKATEQQQQHQQLLSITRTYSSSGGGNNVLGLVKEKNSGSANINTLHPPSQSTPLNVTSNVNQQQQQFIAGSGMQQQQNLAFSSAKDGNLQDNSSQNKGVEGKTLSAAQLMHISASNQVHMQHTQLQQNLTKSVGAASVKLEADDINNSHHVQLQQQTQMQHQQAFRPHSTAPSSVSTTPTDSVPSTPTVECQTPLHVINKHAPQQQQQTSASSANTSQSSTPGPSAGSKDGDQRKKRKRDQTKQSKKNTSNTKETAASSSTVSVSAASGVNNKKRSRKSLKLEEDYDSFIDNLMLHLRQMPPMQVLEPKLNVNYGVCNLYGWRNWTRSTNSSSNSTPKESRQNERANVFEQELEGEYGCGYLPNKVPFYNFDAPEERNSNDDCTASSSIQNNYYDQEFKSFTYKTEPEKLANWVKVYRERSVETTEVVSNKVTIDPVKTMRLNMLQQETFPGLILMSNTQQMLGRMSPVIPIVNSKALITKRKKTPLKPLDNETVHQEMYMKEYPDDIDCKVGLKPNGNSQNVILSLPTSSAERLLDVLKSLANLLQINAPIPYKVVEDSDAEKEHKPSTDMPDSEREMLLKYLSIQDILNGRSKMCRNCGKAIKGRCLKSHNENTKTPLHARLVRPTQPTYFCNKICYIQFRWSIEKKQPLKSVLVSKEGPPREDHLMDELMDVKPDLTMLFDEPKPATTVEETPVEPLAKAKKVSFRYYNSKCFPASTPVKRMSEKEIRDLLFRMNITMSATTPQNNCSELSGQPSQLIEDRRICVLCSQVGDGVADGPSRLLNYDVDKWVHLNCALWSTDVYETISGGLMNFQMALQMGLNQTCNTCHQFGATVKCYKTRCGAVFHLPCAIRDQCVFYQNKTIHCHAHASRNDKDKELLSLAVPRRVYVERDENRQVAAIMHHSEMMNLLRVGSLIFLNVGQLLPHQLEAFHTPNYIYPIGYKMIRFFWSMRRPNKRCRYVCSIAEVGGRPEFRIVVQEPAEADVELRDISPKAVWQRVLQSVAEMRKFHKLVKLYPEFISGEDLFGLTEPTIVRIIESLPGVETLTNYRFKYGRNPLLDLPLALNPSGAARTEPKLRQLMGWKKHHPQRTCSTVSSLGGGAHQGIVTSVTAAGEVTCPYSKQFVHSKSSQYKKMKQEWRNNVYLARSKIQGLGLYAARDLEKHTMIIEYIGEVIRTEVSEIREKQYEARNRGIYMFRLDEDRVVDATLCGGLARYINHSCNPNCVTEIVEVDRELRIIIFAKRRINRGEELSYDYKFDIEDDGSKIPCMCGAPNCRKWMN